MSSNPWKNFRNLVPQDRPGVGEIVAVNGDGTSQVQLVGGGIITAIGSGTVGQDVFLTGNRIDGNAPTVALVTVDV